MDVHGIPFELIVTVLNLIAVEEKWNALGNMKSSSTNVSSRTWRIRVALKEENNAHSAELKAYHDEMS